MRAELQLADDVDFVTFVRFSAAAAEIERLRRRFF